jgi:uncharacterized protein YjbI with pentapeptide repeats
MGLALALVGLAVTAGGHLDQYGTVMLRELFRDLYANLGAELLSIALTVLIIDTLYERREEARRLELQEEKKQAKIELEKDRLLRQLASSINTETMRAAEELRGQGWLEDGTLMNARLSGANLEGADLRHADLRVARLFRANLKNAGLYRADLERAQLRAAKLQGARLGSANLRWANLAGANLREAYLSGVMLVGANLLKANLKDARGLSDSRLADCHCLRGATLPDGSKYDGRFNLKGDLDLARKDGVDTDNPEMMARWYAGDFPVRKKKKPVKGEIKKKRPPSDE